MSFKSLLVLVTLAACAIAAPNEKRACTGTISSLDDVSAAVKCTTININAFTVPAGKTFELDLADGTTVNLNGEVTFAYEAWSGPLFKITGSDITFNGNGNTLNGNGASYWDGKGTSGSTKPNPMIKLDISGTYKNVKVLNSPCRVYSVSNTGALVMSGLTIDDSAGDAANSLSSGKPAAHNTDGFDITNTGSELTIENSTIKNQDDCLAINQGSNINFVGNSCSGGHGISIGSVSSDVTVSNIYIAQNTVTNSVQAFRIKTDASATGSKVTNVTYVGNTASSISSYGVIIDQSYPSTLGSSPGNGVTISDINFITSETTISLESGADKIAVNCGKGSCTGTWNWSKLSTSGGSSGEIVNFSGIEGYSQ